MTITEARKMLQEAVKMGVMEYTTPAGKLEISPLYGGDYEAVVWDDSSRYRFKIPGKLGRVEAEVKQMIGTAECPDEIWDEFTLRTALIPRSWEVEDGLEVFQNGGSLTVSYYGEEFWFSEDDVAEMFAANGGKLCHLIEAIACAVREVVQSRLIDGISGGGIGYLED